MRPVRLALLPLEVEVRQACRLAAKPDSPGNWAQPTHVKRAPTDQKLPFALRAPLISQQLICFNFTDRWIADTVIRSANNTNCQVVMTASDN